MSIVVAQQHPELWDELDAEDADLALMGAAVLDIKTGELCDELQRRADMGLGGRLMFVESVSIADGYRRSGLGPVVLGTAMERLSGGCSVAVLFPAPLDRENPPDGKTVDQAVTALGRTWSKLGFEHFKDGCWIVSLGGRSFERGLRKARRSWPELFN